MTPITRSLALTAVPAALLVALLPPLTADAVPGPGPGDKHQQSLSWSPCEPTGNTDPRQQCAALRVPLDHAEPEGEQISLALSRIPAEDGRARRGALFLIPGGPGGSSLGDPSGKGQKLPQEVRDQYDLIGYAPRGLSPSTAVDCALEPGDLALTRLRPWPAPDGSIDENLATAERMSAACVRNGGELIRHISTRDNARDLDRVRAALGERRISAWGVSYGTYVGAVYSQMFPHRTDRIVLDSNDDPDPTKVARAWLAGHEQGVEDVFPHFAAWASAPGNPDRIADTAAEVRPLFLRLAARPDREPIPWPGADPDELNGNVLRQTMLDSLYRSSRYPALAKLMRAAGEGTVPSAPATPPEPVVQNVTAVGVGTLCNDVAWPKSPAVYEKGVAESRAAYPLTAGMPRNVMPCAAWPYPPREAPTRITGRGPSNILLVQNERDVATPLTGALKMREALGRRAVMVTVNSTGHDAYLADGNPCGDRTVSRFLATGERPHRDTYCR
ncbi:alpha/beta hydrolase [Streptomyces sp. NPDC001273]|uniref:alpha/beta hydrolase n=1 Tax=unclassified Streptomyces TaxID=2593676 RepID=UPI00340026E9